MFENVLHQLSNFTTSYDQLALTMKNVNSEEGSFGGGGSNVKLNGNPFVE